MSHDPNQEPGDETSGGTRRRWLLWIGLAVLVLVLGWFFLKSERTVESQQHAATPPAPAAPQESAPEAPPAPPSDRPREVQAPSAPTDDPIAEYRARTRYAPTSGVLSDQAVDLLEPNRRYDTFVPIEDTANRTRGGEMTFLFTADKYFYEGDDVVTATLNVLRDDEPVSVKITRADAVAESASGQTDESEGLNFRFDDGGYTSTVKLEETFAEHHGPILFTVAFEYEPGKTQESALRVFTTPTNSIPANFTDSFSDGAENGSLVVYAGVEVFEPGFYRLDANLFSADGAPLAFANFKGNLDAGAHRVPLEFFGLLMLDIGVAGPYEVRNVRGYLFLDGEYPDRLRMRDAVGSYWTHAYEVSAFSDEEHMTPHKQKMIELLEQDIQNGIGVDQPKAAVGP